MAQCRHCFLGCQLGICIGTEIPHASLALSSNPSPRWWATRSAGKWRWRSYCALHNSPDHVEVISIGLLHGGKHRIEEVHEFCEQWWVSRELTVVARLLDIDERHHTKALCWRCVVLSENIYT